MTPTDALALISRHGIVLGSGKAAAPNLAAEAAGEPICGSWWRHPKGRLIFSLMHHLEEHPDILVCRLLGGKITYVHRRLWPALIRLSNLISPERLARVDQKHTAAGRHVNHVTPFPEWVPEDVTASAADLTEEGAIEALGPDLVRAILQD